MTDLDQLTVGLVIDMLTEKINDGYDYSGEDAVIEATQAHFDRF